MSMIAIVCGGFGGARFARGFVDAGLRVTLVVNTADDTEIDGVHVSPDVDMCLHALCGELDEEQGWGIAGDTYGRSRPAEVAIPSWFRMGDRDLAYAMMRTALLRESRTLTEATQTLARRRGVTTPVLPMSDCAVRTIVTTPKGDSMLQEFLVRDRAQPHVMAVRQVPEQGAVATAAVLSALRAAEVVVLAPSNPVSSVLPVLSCGGVRETLLRREGPTVAATPVVRSTPPIARPARSRYEVRERFLASRGVPHTAEAVAALYAPLIDGFVGDVRDGFELGDSTGRGGRPLQVALADTLAERGPPRAGLARQVVEFALSLTAKPDR